MGTEVESKMYLPGYYSVNDISNSAGYGGWSLHRESNSLKNGQHYGGYLSKPVMDGVDYDAYDKEMLRQTIMKHESIFRHQVHELHRLYKIQRELMNEMKRKEKQVNQFMPTGTSQSSLFSSGFPSEDDKRSWFFSSFPLVSSDYGRPSSSSADASQSMQSFTKEKTTQSRCDPAQNEPLDLKCKKPKRILIDLELPANEYMNDETKVQEDFAVSKIEGHPFNKRSEVTQCQEKNLSNHTCARRTHKLADLNEPVEVEEVSVSASVGNVGDEINGRIGTFHVKTEKNENKCLSSTFEAGNIRSKSYFGGTFHLEGFRKQCDSSRVESSKASEFAAGLPSDRNNTRKQVKRKIFGVEVLEGNDDSSAFASKAINVVNSETSTISSWTKPQSSFNQNLISVQADSASGCFWAGNCTKSTKTVSDVATPNRYPYVALCRQNGVSVDEPRQVEIQQGGLSWLQKMPLVNGKSLKEESGGSRQMKVDSLQNYSQQFHNETDVRKCPSQSPIQDSSSTTCGHDAEHRRIETSNCPNVKRILGFPIFEFKSKPGSIASVPNNHSLLKTGLAKSDLQIDPVCPRFGELKVQESGKGPVNDKFYARHQIDLNECVIEEEAQPTPPSLVAKPTTGIDLEAPVVVETDLEEESLESKLEKPFDSLGYEPGLTYESLDNIAAEALVAMSSFDVQNLQDNTAVELQENETQPQSDSSPSDFLHWFADIISSYHENFENEVGVAKTGVSHEEASSDGIDEFEYMTLNLPKIKVEECFYKPPESFDLKEEETAVAPRRPRRGQARRGRQRKDFQRDVLPGLVSLSRNEVTEDLQTFEGLVKAIGGTWQSSLSLRNGGKGGGGRGRKRTACSAPTPTPTPTPPAPPPLPPPPYPAPAVFHGQAQQLPNSKELGLDETSFTGWGKRTRRPPRQRCPISTSLLPLK